MHTDVVDVLLLLDEHSRAVAPRVGICFAVPGTKACRCLSFTLSNVYRPRER